MKKPVNAERPFPWICHHCHKKQVFMANVDYTTEIYYQGKTNTLKIPNLDIPVCQNCGEKVFTEKVENQIRMAMQQR